MNTTKSAVMRTRVRYLSLIGLAISSAATISLVAAPQAETITITRPFGEGAAFHVVWDRYSSRPIAVRDTRSTADPAIVAFDETGKPLFHIRPLVDIKGTRARALDIWSTTTAADGSILFAGVMVSSRARVGHVIAHYSNDGRLAKVWDMFPHHSHNVAVDEAGRVHSLSHSLLANDGSPTPIVIRYTPRGQVDATLVTSADLSDYGDPGLVIDSATTDLVLDRKGMTIAVGGANELIRIEDGRIQRKGIEAIAAELWGRNGARWGIRGLVGLDGDVVTEFIGTQSLPDNTVGAVSRFVKIDRFLSPTRIWLEGEGRGERVPSPRVLIGADAPNALVFASYSDQSTVAVVTKQRVGATSATSQREDVRR